MSDSVDVPRQNSASNSNTASARPQVALVGNPNTGKTTLFNKLTGLRARTANYAGITVDVRTGVTSLPGQQVEVIDLPGLYSLHALSPEEKVTHAALTGNGGASPVPSAIVLVLDATCLERNLFVASEVLELGLPTVVALNQIDAAESSGITIDVPELSKELGVNVIPVSARTGRGLSELKSAVKDLISNPLKILQPEPGRSCTAGCVGCTFAARFDWAQRVSGDTVKAPETHGARTAAIDSVLTRPVIGVLMFLAIMLGIFYMIFSLASIPMDMIDGSFGALGEWVEERIPVDGGHSVLWFLLSSGVSAAVLALGYTAAEV
ncbi:MAG: 50S ribosome-binding GTPase, partial [Planctomycetaceae bacterium]|nr:50S ribosome-binding GTPase [Planctomycetaceae bacterium]